MNNITHNHIGIEQVWHTKWCPTQQFTFIFSVSKANIVYSRARGRKAIHDLQLEFRRKLALGLLGKNLDNEGVSINYHICHKKRSKGTGSPVHGLMSRPTHTRMWNTWDNGWTKTKTEYVKIKCAT